MKKIYHVITVILLMTSMSVMSMEELITSLLSKSSNKPLNDNRNVVLFAGSFSIVPVEKSHLPLIRTLYTEYQKHKTIADKGGIVPSFKYVSTEGLPLVNDALKVRPDEFLAFYAKLSPEQRILLIKLSGQYDDKGKRIMLDVPEVTKRLIDVYFPVDVCKHIKKYFRNEDEDFVRAYFKEKLIADKGLLTLKEPMFNKNMYERISQDIYLGSFFFDGGHTINQYDYPIFLRIGDVIHKTYATQFGSDNYEYRITDVDDNQCLVWVIDHDNPNTIFSTPVRLTESIKGCRLSNTNSDVEYAVIYSEHDMVLLEINRQYKLPFVNPIAVDIPEHATIVDVCFNPVKNRWMVGLYEGLASVFRSFDGTGKLNKTGTVIPFKKEGLLEKIAIYKNFSRSYFAAMFRVADQYSILGYNGFNNGGYNLCYTSDLHHIDNYDNRNGFLIIKMIDSMHMFDRTVPFFMKNAQAQKDNQQTQKTNLQYNSLFDYISSTISSQLVQPESEIHRIYSPDGAFLMCNALKKKLGILYVETVLKDAVTHQQIISIDTLYSNFIGVGFTSDGTNLIFINSGVGHHKVSLLDEKDKQMLYEVEKVAFTNSGVTGLLKRLCMECREQGIVTLYEDDSTYRMLKDWTNISPTMMQVLQKCLPIQR
jgi:hypothetical protein